MSTRASKAIKSKFKIERASAVGFSTSLAQSKKLLAPFLKNKNRILIFVDKAVSAKNSYWNLLLNSLKEACSTTERSMQIFEVEGGESIKSFSALESFAAQAIENTKGFSRSEIVMIAVGGGSVGDAIGLLASLTKRGVDLVHIPTTYLSAIDSSHGGKTAINVAGFKNQLGTFYPARFILVDSSFFESLDTTQVTSALGELYKIALIGGGPIWNKWKSLGLAQSHKMETKKIQSLMWSLLPLAINEKYKVVSSDFEETKGLRLKLNLGHTLGHALEARFGLPHGSAVLVGCAFALHFGKKQKLVSQKSYLEMTSNIPQYKDLVKGIDCTSKEVLNSIAFDKKIIAGNKVQFVFVPAPGKVIISKVDIKELSGALDDF